MSWKILARVKNIHKIFVLLMAILIFFNLIQFNVPNFNESLANDQGFEPSNPDIKASGARSTPNSPPYFIKQVEDIVLDEDFGVFQLNLSGIASDNEDLADELKWFITGENLSLINTSNENSSEQLINIHSVDNAFGENLVKLWVSDTTGRNNFLEFTIAINPINDLPFIDQSYLPTIMINANVSFSINLQPYLIDYDTPLSKLKLSVSEKDQSYATIENFLLQINLTDTDNINISNITLKISDKVVPGQSSICRIKFNISDNFPPEITSRLPNITLFRGERLLKIIDLDYYFKDLNHGKEQLKFQHFNGEHLQVSVNDDNSIDILSEGTWIGNEQLIFRCLDPDGAFNEQVINITVTSKYANIKIFPIPNLAVHHDHEYEFNLTPYLKFDRSKIVPNYKICEFIDDNWLEYLKLGNIKLSNLKYPLLKINYSKEFVNNTIPIFLSISNEEITKFQEFTITVSNNYPPILKKPIPNQQIDEDTEKIAVLDLYDFFSDRDNINLVFLNISDQVKLKIDENGLVDMSMQHHWNGIEHVSIRAMDSYGAVTEVSFIVTVNPINDPPIIEEIPEINVTSGKTTSFEFSKYILDVDDNISELEITVDIDHVKVAGNFLILDYPESYSGVQRFTLTVSDGTLSDNREINVNFESSSTPNEREDNTLSPLFFWIVVLIAIILLLFLLLTSFIYINRLRNFRITDIYLIYKDGLLIAHAARRKRLGYDSDIIGSMFTAIQDFIQESFSTKSEKSHKSRLKRLDFGDFQIVIDRGEYVYIAAIFTGFPLRKMMFKITDLREKIEKKYTEILPVWNGNMTKLKGSKKLLEELLYSTGAAEEEETKEKEKGVESGDKEFIKRNEIDDSHKIEAVNPEEKELK
jgi:hypothetical protein